MKKLFVNVLALCLTATVFAEKINLKDYHKKSVLILGDSITQRGAYVNFLEYYIQTELPDVEIDLLSVGLSGERAAESAFNRAKKIYAQKKFDLVLACYGMNDGLYHPLNDERFNAYKSGIKKLTDMATAAGAKIVFMTPTLFENKTKKKTCKPLGADAYSSKTPYVDYDKVLAEFSKHIMSLNPDNINLRAAFLAEKSKFSKNNPQFLFAGDGIHPGSLGNLIMARTIMKGLGVELADVNLNDELKRVGKDPVAKVVKKYRGARSGVWLKFSKNGNAGALKGAEENYRKSYLEARKMVK